MLEVKNEYQSDKELDYRKTQQFLKDNDGFFAIFTDGETYPVIKRNGKFLIARQHNKDFSGDWEFLGVINKKNSKVLIKPDDALKITDWKYKNGNPRYAVVDYDHGSKRVWGGTASSQQLRSFSKVNDNQFAMISESVKKEDIKPKININSKDARNVSEAFNWVIGGYYNCIMDGNVEDIPDNIQDVIDEIYDEAVNNEHDGGYVAIGKQTRTRLSGKENIIAYIKELMKSDEDVREIAEVKGWKL